MIGSKKMVATNQKKYKIFFISIIYSTKYFKSDHIGNPQLEKYTPRFFKNQQLALSRTVLILH